DQAIYPILADLLCELIAVVLYQPDSLDIDVVDLPAFGRTLHAIVNVDLRSITLREIASNDDVFRFGVAAEGQKVQGRDLVNVSQRSCIGSYKRALEGLYQLLPLLFSCSTPALSR